MFVGIFMNLFIDALKLQIFNTDFELESKFELNVLWLAQEINIKDTYSVESVRYKE